MSDESSPTDQELYELLDRARTIAVVGASSKPDRPSNGVFGRLLAAGYRVIPVNPAEREVHGQKAYPSLEAIGEPVDIVDVFRRPEDTPPLAGEAAAVGAKVLWLQSGVVNDETARLAREAGLTIVMDRCIAVELAMLRVPKRPAPGR
jgi:predicted CoA-binding protein